MAVDGASVGDYRRHVDDIVPEIFAAANAECSGRVGGVQGRGLSDGDIGVGKRGVRETESEFETRRHVVGIEILIIDVVTLGEVADCRVADSYIVVGFVLGDGIWEAA